MQHMQKLQKSNASMNAALRYLCAWRDKDASKLTAAFANRGVYIDTTLERELTGAAIKAHAEKLFHLYPDLSIELAAAPQEKDDLIILQWVLKGTNSGALQGQPATQSYLEISGTDYIRTVGNKIASVQVYFDQQQIPLQWRRLVVNNPATTDLKLAKGISDLKPQQGLTRFEAEQLAIRTEEVLRQNKLYLQHDLTMRTVAKKLRCSTNHLSQAINWHLGKNFFDLINGFRVAEACLLIDNAGTKLNVAEIVYAAGFRSQSSLYNAFKQHKRMSPVSYKKQQFG